MTTKLADALRKDARLGVTPARRDRLRLAAEILDALEARLSVVDAGLSKFTRVRGLPSYEIETAAAEIRLALATVRREQ